MATIQKNVKSGDFMIKSFVAGGVAGMCAKTAVAPLDRMKILLQAQNKHYKDFGAVSGIQRILKKEDVRGLYKGNGAQMVRIFPYAAIQFMAFEQYKKLLQIPLGQESHLAKFFAGSMAGVTAVVFTYPLDVVRARLAFQVTGEHLYTGIVDTVTKIFRTEGGTRALFKGFSPTVLGMVPYAGLSFYCFEMFKILLLKNKPEFFGKKTSTGGVVLIVPAKLLCGATAGAIAQTVSYPLDVARRKMQLSMMIPEMNKFSKNFVSTIIIVFKEHGIINGLYRGMSINFLRVVPMVSVSFCSYEDLNPSHAALFRGLNENAVSSRTGRSTTRVKR